MRRFFGLLTSLLVIFLLGSNAYAQTTAKGKSLLVYFSATNKTQAIAEEIVKHTGADIFRIEAKNAYAANPYDDSDRIKDESYNDKRPEVKEFLPDDQMVQYDTIFVGTPIWYHSPVMVVVTFLEHYDLQGKVVIPFVTYNSTKYLNETYQKLYKATPNSVHIPSILPEDLEPGNIQTWTDDDDIDNVSDASQVEEWLKRIGYGKH